MSVNKVDTAALKDLIGDFVAALRLATPGRKTVTPWKSRMTKATSMQVGLLAKRIATAYPEFTAHFNTAKKAIEIYLPAGVSLSGIAKALAHPKSVITAGSDLSVEDLVMYANNEYSIFRHRDAIVKALARKMLKGIYNHDKAKLLWIGYAELAAKSYTDEFLEPPWQKAFPMQLRKEFAVIMADDAYSDVVDEAIKLCAAPYEKVLQENGFSAKSSNTGLAKVGKPFVQPVTYVKKGYAPIKFSYTATGAAVEATFLSGFNTVPLKTVKDLKSVIKQGADFHLRRGPIKNDGMDTAASDAAPNGGSSVKNRFHKILIASGFKITNTESDSSLVPSTKFNYTHPDGHKVMVVSYHNRITYAVYDHKLTNDNMVLSVINTESQLKMAIARSYRAYMRNPLPAQTNQKLVGLKDVNKAALKDLNTHTASNDFTITAVLNADDATKMRPTKIDIKAGDKLRCLRGEAHTEFRVNNERPGYLIGNVMFDRIIKPNLK